MSDSKRPDATFVCNSCGEKQEEWYPGCVTCLGCHELRVMEQTNVGVVLVAPHGGIYTK